MSTKQPFVSGKARGMGNGAAVTYRGCPRWEDLLKDDHTIVVGVSWNFNPDLDSSVPRARRLGQLYELRDGFAVPVED